MVTWNEIAKRVEWIETNDGYAYCPFCNAVYYPHSPMLPKNFNPRSIHHEDCNFIKLIKQEETNEKNTRH